MLRRLICTASLFLLSACVGQEPAAQGESSAILPVEIQAELRPGEGKFAPDRVYVSERARSGTYDKIMLDPMLYYAPLREMQRVSSSDRQVLLDNFHILMSRELAKDFTLVDEPQAGAVRVQFAVLPATFEPVALDTIAMVARSNPQALTPSEALIGPVIHEADLLVEAEWTDSVTGEVLGATIDRHFGQGPGHAKTLKNWGDVNRVLETYAALIRYRLCVFRKAQNCAAPAG
jgi:Protein of unknown function (DUF3313)